MPARMPDHYMGPIGAAGHHVGRASLLVLWDVCFIRESNFGSSSKWKVNGLPALDLRIKRIARSIVAGSRTEAAISSGGLARDVELASLDLGAHLFSRGGSRPRRPPSGPRWLAGIWSQPSNQDRRNLTEPTVP